LFSCRLNLRFVIIVDATERSTRLQIGENTGSRFCFALFQEANDIRFVIFNASSLLVLLKFGKSGVGLPDAHRSVMCFSEAVDHSSRDYENCWLVGDCRRERIYLETVFDLLSPEDGVGEFACG
jgi:hypothetical protein